MYQVGVPRSRRAELASAQGTVEDSLATLGFWSWLCWGWSGLCYGTLAALLPGAQRVRGRVPASPAGPASPKAVHGWSQEARGWVGGPCECTVLAWSTCMHGVYMCMYLCVWCACMYTHAMSYVHLCMALIWCLCEHVHTLCIYRVYICLCVCMCV